MKRTGKRGKALAKKAELNDQAVRDLMKSVDNPKIETLLKLADALDVPATSLFRTLVPLSGDITAEGIVRFREDESEPELADVPPTRFTDLCAFKVCVTLWPAHREGDILYVSRQHDVIEENYLGEECIVRLLDGTGFLCFLDEASSQKKGFFDLQLTHREPLKDVRLAWAAPVLFKTSRWHQLHGHASRT